MTGWIKTTLGELCVVIMGQSPPSSTYNTDKNGLPFFQGKAEFSDLYPVPQKWCSKTKKEAEEGNILISVRAPVGDVNIANQHCCIGRGLAAIKYDACPRFIFYFLKHSKSELEKLSTGTTFKAISKQTILNYSLFIPSLVLQHRIVAKIEELFSELDNGTESLKKAREQLKTYRQAVLKYAFEGKLTKEWRTLQRQVGNPPEPAEKLLEQIKTKREKHYQKQLEDWKMACELAKADGKKKTARPKKPKELLPLSEKELAELPELPQGWGWVRTEQVGHIETGTTPSKKSPENYGKEYPFYKPTDLNEGKNVRKAHDNLSEVGYSKARILPINSILVTCIGATIGKTGIIRKEGAFNQQINAIIPFNRVVPDFVYYQAICQFFQNQIIFKASSTTLPILNKSKFENLFFALTSYEEQHTITSEIESRLSVCDKIEQTVEDSLKKAEALRQSILKKAFAGELTEDWREKHPELVTGENSAEKLLEKIKTEKALAAGRKKPRSKKMTSKKVKIETAKQKVQVQGVANFVE